jgi:hypothetical protein
VDGNSRDRAPNAALRLTKGISPSDRPDPKRAVAWKQAVFPLRAQPAPDGHNENLNGFEGDQQSVGFDE